MKAACQCASINPGITVRPVPSMTHEAPSPDGAGFGPFDGLIALIVLPAISMSCGPVITPARLSKTMTFWILLVIVPFTVSSRLVALRGNSTPG